MPAEIVRLAVRDRGEAERFVSGLLAAMHALQAVLAEETTHLSAGRIGLGLAREADKSALAATYLRGLEHLKANAVALARFAPEALSDLKTSHAAFQEAVARNQAVIATARAVAEGLIRTLSDEMSRKTRPATYGAPSPGRPPAARPLLFSGRL